ncbi:transglycosylase SLT domain-containing protein [Pannus brasiliensis CCIBt3594]|uniref:Transglycosylase SLT domain-containing protein n=1 Tax=Pannus brasiliensis CCIBt3594 TaxID=1427578 RepID=A0AAW9QUQ7_9CHRO
MTLRLTDFRDFKDSLESLLSDPPKRTKSEDRAASASPSGPSNSDRLTDFHGFPDGTRWRLVAGGVEIEGSGIERTKGQPVTVTRIWERYATEINEVARQYRVPCALILATICTESGGKPDAVREEPGYQSDEKTPHKISAGLMQTLISTARETLQLSLDRSWLTRPKNSILAGTAYIAKQARKTRLDPPLVAAAYNAGDLYRNTGRENRWKLRQYPIGTGAHLDRFVKFFNDAVFVLGQHPTAPAVGIDGLLGETPPRPRTNTPPPSSEPTPAPSGSTAPSRGSTSGTRSSSETTTTALSGASWVNLFPTSRSVEDLEVTFANKVKRFLAALRDAGAEVKINATYRPPERAYLMHWCWKIHKGICKPEEVPSREGVNIVWSHDTPEKSRSAAREMVNGYGMQNLEVAPSLKSRHILRRAIDMNVSWTGNLEIRTADGRPRVITSNPKDGTNPDLIEVGKTYGVVHFDPPHKDRPHWSEDGK